MRLKIIIGALVIFALFAVVVLGACIKAANDAIEFAEQRRKTQIETQNRWSLE